MNRLDFEILSFQHEKCIQFQFQADARFPDVMDPAILLANSCHIEGLFYQISN